MVTNSKYIAEQVKNDRVGKLVTDGPKVVKKRGDEWTKNWKSYGEQRDEWTNVEGHRKVVKSVATDGRRVRFF